MLFRFFLFAMLIVLNACEKSYDDAFTLAYAELRIAQVEYQETEDGKITRLQILEKHGFSLDDFEKKIQEIRKDPEKWLVFQNKLIKILDSITNNNLKTEE